MRGEPGGEEGARGRVVDEVVRLMWSVEGVREGGEVTLGQQQL